MGAVTADASAEAPRRTLRERVSPGLLAVGALALGVLVLLAWLLPTRTVPSSPLDPQNPAPEGARAVAQVLGREGVQVVPVRDRQALSGAPAGPGSTVVVTRAAYLGGAGLRAVAATRPDRIVLVEPNGSALDALGLEVDVRPAPEGRPVAAGCSWSGASGLTLSPVGERYDVHAPSGAISCFTPGDGFAAGGDQAGQVVFVPAGQGRPEIVLVGTDQVLANETIVDDDNAAVALRILGSTPRTIWWNVNPRDADADAATPAVVPTRFAPAVMILALTILVWMIVRGRRLGRLVTEPLPVLVRAEETTRARGRLYEQAADLPRAAALLQRGTRRRLSLYLGVRDRAPDLVPVVAEATGRSGQQVEDLLYGPAPGGDHELTHLAQQLRDLERQARP